MEIGGVICASLGVWGGDGTRCQKGGSGVGVARLINAPPIAGKLDEWNRRGV